MALPRLVPGQGQVVTQETTFSIDAVARFVCNTWDEAVNNGGPPFTAVVVGSGAYGAYCAHHLYSQPGQRILLLEAGPFLIPEHQQNTSLGKDVFNSPDPPWTLPWRGNVAFPGLAYCVGGKSVFWGGWCPRLTEEDLSRWPAATAAYLRDRYIDVESETGVVPGTDFIFGELHEALFPKVAAAAATIPDIERSLGTNGVEPAPLAVQGNSPVSGLFSFDKYSSVPVLIDTIRDDVKQSGGDDARRRMFLVPRARVLKLHTANGVVEAVEVDAAGRRETLRIAPDCAVILAASAIESTRIALHSFPTPLMGRNLMAHIRTDFSIRVRRSVLPPVPPRVQSAAMLVRGKTANGRFHVQVTASTSREEGSETSDVLLYRMIPDLEEVNAHVANDSPEWVSITLRGIGEMTGDKTAEVPNDTGSWINLSPFESDELGVPRAYVRIVGSPTDHALWLEMDEATVALIRALAGDPANAQYWYDDKWHADPFPTRRAFPGWHRGLGTTYHESGTLWMGDDPATSVTDPTGRFHHVRNAWACDQSLFPTVGSVNPVLTGLTLARLVAESAAAL